VKPPPRGGRRNGSYAGPATGPLGRVCPKCGAGVGWRCVSVARDGGDWQKPLAAFHADRRRAT
jgi:hypothetical protein